MLALNPIKPEPEGPPHLGFFLRPPTLLQKAESLGKGPSRLKGKCFTVQGLWGLEGLLGFINKGY